MTHYINNEPFKEKPCVKCGKILKETRVRIGRTLKCYRIWVHKETRKKACHNTEIDNIDIWQTNHKPICQCGECEFRRMMTGR